MAYRVSFNLIAASDNRIHVITEHGSGPVCGCVPMAYHKLFNIGEIKRSTFCNKCLKTYHKRPEEEFAIINDKSTTS